MSRFRFTTLLITVLTLAILADAAPALYVRVEVAKVPVERIVKNLEEAVKKNPKDVQATVNLARAHAMAYSLRSNEVPVDSKRPDTIWFGYEPPIVPFRRIEKTDDPERLKAAKEHLDKALKLYEEARKLAPNDLRIHLGYAWLLSQTDNKADAVKELRAVAEKGWEKDKNLKALGLGGHTVTAEAAEYLIPLLDPEKDKDEIAMWKERSDHLKKLPRPITPIAFPLRDGLTATDLEDRTARVTFDADGTGLQKQWTWITRDAAWLVYDPKCTGKITSALEMFGSVTFWLFWETGYDALAALDDDHDGQLTGKELVGLALWHDANGNGVCDPGEVKPLAEYGIVGLSCKYERDLKHPDAIAWSPKGVTFHNGATRPTFDLVLHPTK